MSNVIVNQPVTVGATIATIDDAGVQHQQIVVEKLVAGVPTPIDSDNKLPVDTGLAQGLTDAELRITPVIVQATNLDIRDLSFATDKVDVSGSTIAIDTAGLATEGKQDTEIQLLTNIQFGDGSAIGGSVFGNAISFVDNGNGKIWAVSDTHPLPVLAAIDTTGLATEATLASMNGKIPPSPATKGDQTTGNNFLQTIAGAVSGTEMQVDIVTSALPSGASTSAKQDTGNTSLGSIDTKLSSQATAAKQDTGNTSLGSIDTKLSSQATAAKQDTGNTSIASIDTKIPALGQALAAASVPIVLTAAQLTTLTPPAAIAGYNLEATQLLVKAKTDNIPALGQALAAASVPVVLTAAQLTTLTPPAAITGYNLEATQLLVKAAVEVMDDWDESDRAKVNPISGQAGVSANDGNVDAGTQRVTIAANVLSSVNSSTTPLAAFVVFTGTSEDIMSYNEVRITVYSDVPSAIDGLSIQQSTDNTNWIITDTYSIVAATGKTFSVPRQGRYFRVVYTNGYAVQATFILQTSFTRIGGKSSSQKPTDNYTNETDLEQQQSFMMNYNPNTNTWYRVRGDSTNGLMVNPNGFNVEYSRRLQEQQVLLAYSALMEEVGATERYNSSRDFIEIR